MKYDAFSKCHPLTNFIFFLGAISFSVVIQHPLYVLAGCLGSAVYYGMLKGRKGLRLILGMIPVFVLLSVINPLLNTLGETVLFSVFGAPYTWEALCHGMAVAGMFVQMLLWFGCYSQVLTSDKFICLFGRLIPALSLLLVMVLRMIPNLMRKARQLLGARRSIGKGSGEKDPLRKKLSGGMTALSTLTDWALEGSIVTADSMRARGYGSAKRTGFSLYRITLRDILLMALMAALAVFTLAAGHFDAAYTPALYAAAPSWGLAAYCILLLLPTLLHIKEAVQWQIAISSIPEPVMHTAGEADL